MRFFNRNHRGVHATGIDEIMERLAFMLYVLGHKHISSRLFSGDKKAIGVGLKYIQKETQPGLKWKVVDNKLILEELENA